MSSYGIKQVVVDLLTGNITLANSSVRQERQDICTQCEARNTKLNTCTVCGCFLPAKRALAKAECPMGLW